MEKYSRSSNFKVQEKKEKVGNPICLTSIVHFYILETSVESRKRRSKPPKNCFFFMISAFRMVGLCYGVENLLYLVLSSFY